MLRRIFKVFQTKCMNNNSNTMFNIFIDVIEIQDSKLPKYEINSYTKARAQLVISEKSQY